MAIDQACFGCNNDMVITTQTCLHVAPMRGQKMQVWIQLHFGVAKKAKGDCCGKIIIIM